MSDQESPTTIVEHAVESVLGELVSENPDRYSVVADVLRRVLTDGTLSSHLTPKTLGALADELLDALAGDEGDGDAA